MPEGRQVVHSCHSCGERYAGPVHNCGHVYVRKDRLRELEAIERRARKSGSSAAVTVRLGQ